jgi:hypothetical protein
MPPMHALRNYAAAMLAIGAALFLASCNSTIGDDTTSGTTTNASATGFWSGSDSVSGDTVLALINAAGQATFIRSDGLQFTGTVQVSGSNLVTAVDGYTPFPNTFSDGSSYGIGTLNGTVVTGSSITATLSFTTNGNTALSGSWSLNYQAVSNNASSTGAIAGNYTDNSTGAVLSINSNGVMSEQNPTTGCVLNGSVSTNDTTHDLYEVAFSYGSCSGTYIGLNDVQFTGLATLNNSVSPAVLTLAVAGVSATSVQYGIVSQLTGN